MNILLAITISMFSASSGRSSSLVNWLIEQTPGPNRDPIVLGNPAVSISDSCYNIDNFKAFWDGRAYAFSFRSSYILKLKTRLKGDTLFVNSKATSLAPIYAEGVRNEVFVYLLPRRKITVVWRGDKGEANFDITLTPNSVVSKGKNAREYFGRSRQPWNSKKTGICGLLI
jgi:hypothetical protein